MDRRTSNLESLPPLELRRLRSLDLETSPGAGRPAHISSASGVARRGDYVYVIGDDLLLRHVFAGTLPSDEQERSAAKPDLEALTMLPPFEDAPYGALLGLGSRCMATCESTSMSSPPCAPMTSASSMA